MKIDEKSCDKSCMNQIKTWSLMSNDLIRLLESVPPIHRIVFMPLRYLPAVL